MINLFRAGSSGELAKGESSARGKETWMNNWLALPEKGHPTAHAEGDKERELYRRAGENWKSTEEVPSCSFGELLAVHYQHATANCWKKRIPNDNKRQRFWELWNKDPHKELKQDKYCHKDAGMAPKKVTLPPSCAEQHQVVRPFLHVRIILSWGLIANTREKQNFQKAIYKCGITSIKQHIDCNT